MPQPERVEPSPTKWVIGIVTGLVLIAWAKEIYPTAEPWFSVGLIGAASVGVFGGMICAAIDNANPMSRIGVVTTLTILIAGTVIAGFLVGWWAVLSFFLYVMVGTATYFLYT